MMPRRAVRIAVFVALVASALATFMWGGRLWQAALSGSLPLWVALLPPVMFSGFVLVYALDRWVQFRRRRHRLGWVLLQIGGAFAFLSLLWSGQAERMRHVQDHVREVQAVPDPAVRLLYHPAADARATACEVLNLRVRVGLAGETQTKVVELAAEDPSALVRSHCAALLQRFGGS